ncbi:hypothetical protein SM793_00045 [Kitasatospora purpeofusca]|nr:hypothetical protein [Kitasatospora purpeofusca]MDY0809786.1 hypothetical protein [Kitasatospora purpeofusca]
MHSTGEGLLRIDTVDGWSGKAGDAFRAAFHGEPKKWLEAGDSFHEAATALAAYQSALAWAQGEGQTGRIVVNLSDSPVDVPALKSQLHDWPIEGLEEAVVIDRQGNIVHIYP